MAKVEQLMHDEARTQMANNQNTNGQTTPIHLQKGPDTPHGLHHFYFLFDFPFSFF